MDNVLIARYYRHVAAVFDRQMRLADFLAREASGQPWNYTVSTATLTFGNAIRFSALVLGAHANPDNSWLWAWNQPDLHLTPANRELGEAVRKLGRDAGIPALVEDRKVSCADLLGPDLSPAAAHVFAVVVAGELGFDAYYAMPLAQGQVTAVIRDERLRADVPSPAARIATIFPQVLSAFPVLNHRAAFIAYVGSYGLAIEETQQAIRVLVGQKEALRATFDDVSRLTHLTASAGPGGDV